MTDRTCSVDGCGGKSRTRGYCKPHYNRWHVYGDPEPEGFYRLGEGKGWINPPRRRSPVLDLDDLETFFWKRVEKTDTCWLWTGKVLNKGRGHGYGREKLAHRISYEMFVGPIPADLEIDHTCHVRICVNPDHMRLVTRKQNSENHAGPNRNNLSSGVRGVTAYKGKWRASVGHNGRRYRGGVYDSIAEAEAAAIELRNRLFTHNDADRVA